MLALSSPSALIWFATVGGSMIAAEERGPSLLAAGFFLAGFLSAGLVWSVFAAALSHQARRYGGRTMLRWLNALSGALFLYFAVRVFLTGPNGDTVGAGPHSP
jgi:L-lysine exporter family protein LysE/ArgO